MPAVRRERLLGAHGLPASDVAVIGADRELADLFEGAVATGAPAKQVANWILATHPALDGPRLAELIGLVVAGTINRDQGMRVLDEAQATGRTPGEIVRSRGLSQVSDVDELTEIVDRVIAERPQAAADVRAGKTKAIGPLVGAVVAATSGRANAKVASELLRKRLIG
jgi:aspartyl-tRNA(Asn)/glutamyl-tRNA(Gln) amidotransferase subunit B